MQRIRVVQIHKNRLKRLPASIRRCPGRPHSPHPAKVRSSGPVPGASRGGRQAGPRAHTSRSWTPQAIRTVLSSRVSRVAGGQLVAAAALPALRAAGPRGPRGRRRMRSPVGRVEGAGITLCPGGQAGRPWVPSASPRGEGQRSTLVGDAVLTRCRWAPAVCQAGVDEHIGEVFWWSFISSAEETGPSGGHLSPCPSLLRGAEGWQLQSAAESSWL